MFYDNLNKKGRAAAAEILVPIVGPVKFGKGYTPGGDRVAVVNFKKLTSTNPDWNAKLKALRVAGFYPDTLHVYGFYVCSSAFIGPFGPANQKE